MSDLAKYYLEMATLLEKQGDWRASAILLRLVVEELTENASHSIQNDQNVQNEIQKD